MKDGKDDCDYCAPRVPLERYRMNPSAVQEGNCRGKDEKQDCYDPQVHDQRFAENRGVRDLLKHDSLHNSDGTFHERMNHAVIVIGTRAIELLAGGLT